MKTNRYFIIEPPKFTDKKWQLAVTTEKSKFAKIVSDKKYSVCTGSKSLDVVLFAAHKLGIRTITSVGEKNRKIKCDRRHFETVCLVLSPSLHEKLRQLAPAKYYNAKSQTWCLPSDLLEKSQYEELNLPVSYNSDYLILSRS